MVLIKSPVILKDRDGCIYIFKSPGVVERAIEITDVEDDEYAAFDSEGRRLILMIVPTKSPQRNAVRFRDDRSVRVALDEQAPPDPKGLRDALVRVLCGTESGAKLADLPLQDLVDVAVQSSNQGFLQPPSGAREG